MKKTFKTKAVHKPILECDKIYKGNNFKLLLCLKPKQHVNYYLKS